MIKLEGELPAGECILCYGPTDSGKTGSALTCYDPILHINTEGKDARPIHADIIRFSASHGTPITKKITYIRFESFDDSKSSLNDWIDQARRKDFPFRTVFFDGLTFGQQNIKRELEVSRSDIRHDSKEWRGLVDSFRFEKPDWGAMGSAMSTVTDLMMKLSSFGVTVIATALEDSNYPKWGKGLRIGPALTGQDFSKLLPGFFHFIGYIIRPFKLAQNGTLSMPMISFNGETDIESGNDYLARSSSITLSTMGPAPLDWSRILSVIHNKKEV